MIHGTSEEKSSQVSQSVSHELITRESNKNFSDVIGNIAGVNIIRNGSGISKPVIHGLYGNRISIVNNGMVQAGQQWGNDHAPEIDPFFADHISVIKGVSALEFSSNSLGGVVKMEPGSIGSDPHMHGTANYIFQSNGRGHTANVKLEKGNGKISWRTALTWKKAGDTKSPDYYLTNTGKNELNGALQVQKQLAKDWKFDGYYSIFNTEIGILRASHLENAVDFFEAIERDPPQYTKDHFSYDIEAPRQQVQHHLIKFNGKKLYENGGVLSLTGGGQLNRRKEFDRRRNNHNHKPAMSMNLLSNFIEATYFLTKSNGIDVKVGFQNTLAFNRNDNRATGVLPLIPQYQSYFPGMDLYWGKSKKQDGFYELGGRYDFRQLNVQRIARDNSRTIERFSHTFHNVNVLGGVSRKFGQVLDIGLSFGYTQRAPEVNEMHSYGLHQGVSGFEVGLLRGNDQVDHVNLEKSMKQMITADLRLNNQLFIQTLGYYQLIDDYIFLEPSGEFNETIRGKFQVFNYRQTDSRISGMDFSLVYEPTHDLKMNVKYAMVRGWDLENEKWLTFIPSDYTSSSISYSFHDIGNLNHITIEFNGRYTFEQTRYDEILELVQPPSSYFLFGANISSSVSFQKSSLELSVRGENLMNKKYRDYMNRLRYFADETGINLSVGLTYKF